MQLCQYGSSDVRFESHFVMTTQWRIRDIPGGEAPTLGGRGGAPTYDFANFFSKNCMKLKEFGPRGGEETCVQNFTM